jgi:hypothetical protein
MGTLRLNPHHIEVPSYVAAYLGVFRVSEMPPANLIPCYRSINRAKNLFSGYRQTICLSILQILVNPHKNAPHTIFKWGIVRTKQWKSSLHTEIHEEKHPFHTNKNRNNSRKEVL